jgi:sugar phosphate isomerase/epimerase
MQLGLSDHPSLNIKLSEFLDFASELDAKHVEIKLDSPSLLSAMVKVNQALSIVNLLTSYNFKYFLHVPSIDINLASLNPNIGKASEKIVIDAVRFASKVNAELVVSHAGRLSRDYPQSFIEKAFENVLTRLRRIVKVSKDLGIIFTIENDHKASDYLIAGYPKQVLSLVRNLGCKLTLDIGHAKTLGKIGAFLDTLSMYTVNVHLHDNNGAEDEHMPLGKGKIPIAKLLRKIKTSSYSPSLTLECHSIEGLRQDYNLLKRLL